MKGQHRELRDSVWARAWDGGLANAQLLVALRLVEHWPNIFPGEKTVARWTQLGESTVREAIRQLEKERILRVERTPGRVNHYWFLDRHGRDISPGFPDVGPTPPESGGAPRQNLAHPPPESGAPTPPESGAEADPDLKREPKAGMEAGGMPAVLHELPEGFKPSEGLLAAAELAGCPRALFLERLAELGTGPIGGTRGVTVGKLDTYLLVMAGKWKAWAAKAPAGAQGARGGALSVRDARGQVLTLEPSSADVAFATKHGLDINAVLTDIHRTGTIEALGLGRAREIIGEKLRKLAKGKANGRSAADRESGSAPRGDGATAGAEVGPGGRDRSGVVLGVRQARRAPAIAPVPGVPGRGVAEAGNRPALLRKPVPDGGGPRGDARGHLAK